MEVRERADAASRTRLAGSHCKSCQPCPCPVARLSPASPRSWPLSSIFHADRLTSSTSTSHAAAHPPFGADDDIDPFELNGPWEDLEIEIQRHSRESTKVVYEQTYLSVPAHEEREYDFK